MGFLKHLQIYEKFLLRIFTELNIKFPLVVALAHLLKFTAVVVKDRQFYA